MAIGDGLARSEEPKRRGCLFWIGMALLASFCLAMIGVALRPQAGSGTGGPSDTPGTSATASAYQPLTDAQKAAALRHMTKEVDGVEDITFYYDRTTNRDLGSSGFYAYAAQKDGAPWLRLIIRYAGPDWLFFNRVTIKTEAFKLDLAGLHPERHVGEGYVAEWIDAPVTRREYALLAAVAMAKHAVIRLEGPQFQHDRTITQREKTAIANVVMAYRALGAGSPP